MLISQPSRLHLAPIGQLGGWSIGGNLASVPVLQACREERLRRVQV